MVRMRYLKTPFGFGAFLSSAMRKSIGMSLENGGLYSQVPSVVSWPLAFHSSFSVRCDAMRLSSWRHTNNQTRTARTSQKVANAHDETSFGLANVDQRVQADSAVKQHIAAKDLDLATEYIHQHLGNTAARERERESQY